MRVTLTYRVPVAVEVLLGDHYEVDRVIVIDDSLTDYDLHRPEEVEFDNPGLLPDEEDECRVAAINALLDEEWPAWEVGP